VKRVRYLAGAAGLAPLAFGMGTATAATHAGAEATGHAKTVSLHAASGHRPAGPAVVPDITRVDCSHTGDWLWVYQSDSAHADCFANAGSEDVKIYHIDVVYTGNNGVSFWLAHKPYPIVCYEPDKNTNVFVSSCSSELGARGVYNNDTMSHLAIFPGTG
jgi:hypothetical protein